MIIILTVCDSIQLYNILVAHSMVMVVVTFSLVAPPSMVMVVVTFSLVINVLVMSMDFKTVSLILLSVLNLMLLDLLVMHVRKLVIMYSE